MNTVCLAVAIAGVTIAACGVPDRSSRTATADSSGATAQAPSITSDTSAARADSSATPSVPMQPAPSPAPVQAAPVADLRGNWTLRRVPAIDNTPQLQLAVDSIDGNRFRTRVAFYMAGDVGAEPTNFRPEWGTLTGGVARFPVAMRRNPLRGEIGGVLASPDTINVQTYHWGGEDLLAADRDRARWLLVREH